MRASILKKSLIIGIVFFLLLLLAGNASSEVEPIYAGWTVGSSWDDDGDGPNQRYGTILRSTDSGETWIRQGAGQIEDVCLEGVFAVDPYTAWVVGDPANGFGTIYQTTDGGITWERKGSQADVPDVKLSKVHARDDDVWAVGTGTILHTSNGGTTWTNHVPSCYNDILLQGVYVLNSSTVWVTGGAKDGYGTILKTTDGGLTWNRQSWPDVCDEYVSSEHILGISAADADTAWAVGGNYSILKTTDRGATWQRYPGLGGLYDMNEVYAVNTSTAWAAGDNAIYWTTDGGQNWYSSAEHGLSGEVAYMDISAVSNRKAWGSYIHEQSSLPGRIVYTTDGGTNWTTIDHLNGAPLPGLSNISFATQPINLDDFIISLIGDVEQLVYKHWLNKGQGNALIVKLERALDRLVDDRLKPAVNSLEAFSNQVDAFVLGGVLPSEIGQALSDQVNDFIELISSSL